MPGSADRGRLSTWSIQIACLRIRLLAARLQGFLAPDLACRKSWWRRHREGKDWAVGNCCEKMSADDGCEGLMFMESMAT